VVRRPDPKPTINSQLWALSWLGIDDQGREEILPRITEENILLKSENTAVQKKEFVKRPG
jgi:hypothetical protein